MQTQARIKKREVRWRVSIRAIAVLGWDGHGAILAKEHDRVSEENV
jgi:hypothetical protein